jgi:hypothetical protein
MYSPAAISIRPGALSRISRKPAKSSELTGSSNQRMSASAQAEANDSASLTAKAVALMSLERRAMREVPAAGTE